MKTSLFIIINIAISSLLNAQQIIGTPQTFTPKKHILLQQSDLISIPSDQQSKILSGMLIRNISEKKFLYTNGLLSEANANENVTIYVNDYPAAEQISELEDLGVKCDLENWTPPLNNHAYGYFLAEVPVTKFTEALSLDLIKKIETAEYESFPQNNSAVISINADDLWTTGYDGTGVKVGILDSGIDTYYEGTEFPSSFERMDYSAYPTIDTGVENTVTGHGTHVAGTVLGRGTNSIGRTNEGNGLTPFKGSAPGANLTFLKIGSDATGSASSDAMIAAMDAAVNIYNVDVLSMSYGGWHTYHDGSESLEQKVDWVYSQGVPFFISAGNSAADGHHYSGTVAAGSETGYIAVNTSTNSALTFNLVWYDGPGTHNNLYMQYYNSSFSLLTKSESPTTESLRGTESKYSNHTSLVPAGTYYVKVFNTSANSQFFHIYFDNWGYANITFANPDPEYTIGQPASADNGFAVGSYVSRDIWVASSGSSYWFGSTFVLNDIAPYSSRGPRVNGGVIKPNISAPGSAIISVRDTDVLTSVNAYWIDNDGTLGSGNANYYVMTGTSMACPITAGAAALLLDKEPTATPQLIYDAIQNSSNKSGTGTVPNNIWGYGKLDVLAASEEPLPVELSSFYAHIINKKVYLKWRTETEVNNYGFEVERKIHTSSPDFKQDDIEPGVTMWEGIGFVAGNGNSNAPKDYSFEDADAVSGKYFYRLKQIDNDGEFDYSKEVEIDLGVPLKFALNQNYPNPFNPSTIIRYAIASRQFVTLKVFDVLGKEVATLVNEEKPVGSYIVAFESAGGSLQLASGVYYYQLRAGEYVQTKKMMIVK